MSIRSNPLIATDSYKASHFKQYPPGTTKVFSYVESRGGAFDRTVFFGLSIFVQNHLSKRITQAQVEEAKTFYEAHLGPGVFPYEGWTHIVQKLGGKIPVRIRALSEGSVVPVKTPLLVIENTDPTVPWIVGWVETALLRAVWYPTTVATVSWHCKQEILAALMKSSDDPWGQIPFKLHDFGARGVSSAESAAIGGAVLNSKGYYVLKNVRVIQGDGISGPAAIREILDAVLAAGYSADNVAFGMGGGLLQHCNRDTLRFAMKCSAVIIEQDGKTTYREVYKDPVTDPGKASKRGFLDVLTPGYTVVSDPVPVHHWDSALLPVFDSGLAAKSYTPTLDRVRESAEYPLRVAFGLREV